MTEAEPTTRCITEHPERGLWELRVDRGTAVRRIATIPTAAGCGACRVALEAGSTTIVPELPLVWEASDGEFDALQHLRHDGWFLRKVGPCACRGDSLYFSVATEAADGPDHDTFAEARIAGTEVRYYRGLVGPVRVA